MKYLVLFFALMLSFTAFSQNIPETTEVTLTAKPQARGEGNTIVSLKWEQISGPATPRIVSPDAAVTKITGFNTAGVYVYRITAKDANGLSASSTVKVSVLPPNLAPVVTAESEVIIRLPAQ